MCVTAEYYNTIMFECYTYVQRIHQNSIKINFVIARYHMSLDILLFRYKIQFVVIPFKVEYNNNINYC